MIFLIILPKILPLYCKSDPFFTFPTTSYFNILCCMFGIHSSNRFRYSKRILDDLKQLRTDVEQKLQAMGQINDSILTRIEKHIKDVEAGLCVSLLFGGSPSERNANNRSLKMFGSANRCGWDIYLVSFFLLFLFCSLLSATYFVSCDRNDLYWAIFLLSSLGIIIPYVFIIMGASYIRFYKNKIDNINSEFDEHKFKITRMQQEIKNNYRPK